MKKVKRKKAKLKQDKIKRIAIILGVLIFAVWLVIKLLLVYWYNSISVDLEFFEGMTNKTYYKVSTDIISDNEYLEYDNIKFKSCIDDSFESNLIPTLIGDETIQYYSSLKNGAISIGTDYSWIGAFATEHTFFGDNVTFDFYLRERARSKYLEKNNVNNDIEFIELVNDVKDTKVSIFTPIYKIREIGTLKLFASVVFPTTDELTILEGDLNGYVISLKDRVREIHIQDGEKIYFISLIGSYFTEEMYEDIIDTLIIN